MISKAPDCESWGQDSLGELSGRSKQTPSIRLPLADFIGGPGSGHIKKFSSFISVFWSDVDPVGANKNANK